MALLSHPFDATKAADKEKSSAEDVKSDRKSERSSGSSSKALTPTGIFIQLFHSSSS